ncbi:MAG: hypothetical protein R3B06_28590 [Kofleriaceae bacterium]
MLLRVVAPALLVAAACRREPAPPPPGKLVLVAAPADGEVAPWVAAQVAALPDRQVLVYVGAAWCEPCRYFHDAAAAGQLDRVFPRLTVLEFDADRDDARLGAAGYGAQMIPLFARPGVDGRAAGPRSEGSIKGPGAVEDLTERLFTVLAR